MADEVKPSPCDTLNSDEWIISSVWEHVETAARRWRVPHLIAQILHNRGLDLDDPVADFIDPQLANLVPPERLSGADDAAVILAAAVRDGRRIMLYGDYDVDGIAGTAILWHVLSHAGAKVGFYVPHRIEEGYGLNLEAISTLARDGAELIVTVDCGITAIEVGHEARRLGLPLIITDHHQRGSELPEAKAIVHPALNGTYPNPHLCGAGVAFKLAWALARELSGSSKVLPDYRELLSELLPLAALATVADVVPLTGENRIIVVHGLSRLTRTSLVGLQALMESSGLANGKVNSLDVGYKLGPRLNAAGRMGHARLAVELLTRADPARAREIAALLEEQNRARQSLERKVVQQAKAMVEECGMHRDACRGIVLAAEGWHGGVIGIVAGRLADHYRRPTVLIGLSKDVAQGSARGVDHFDVHEALAACAGHLVSYGGHPMAGGLRIRPENVTAFADAFIAQANARLTGVDLRKRLRLDASVSLIELDAQTVQAIERLGPFGLGNPKPRLATGWLDLYGEPRLVGTSGDHLQATFREDGVVMRSIGFGKASAAEPLKTRRRCRLAIEPMINEYNGRRSVEMQVIDYRFDD